MNHEATLREVLAEINLLDLLNMAKGGLAYFGCLGIVVIATSSFAAFAGVDSEYLGAPPWLFWLLLTWFFVWIAGRERSHHEIHVTWFFPRIGPLSALACSGYLVGAYYVFAHRPDTDAEVLVRMAYMAMMMAYLAPFWGGMMLLQIGHGRLMAKRLAQQRDEPQDNWFVEN